MLSHGRARSSAITQAHRLWSRGPSAACQLLQSFAIREHNPRDQPSPAHSPEVAPKGRLFAGGRASFEAQPAEVSQARGRTSKSYDRRPSVAIARGGSLSPTWSARTPPVASSFQRRLEKPTLKVNPVGYPRARRAGFAFTCPLKGPPYAFPREGERAPLHPRCLPSTSCPR